MVGDMTMEKPLGKTAMYLARALCLCILLFVAYQAFAHHQPKHRVVYLNDYTVNQAQLGICLKKEHSGKIMESAKSGGSAGYAGALQSLTQLGFCGIVQGHLKVLEVYETYKDPEGVTLTLARIQIKLGNQESSEVYSLLINIMVEPKDARCDGCRPA